MNCIESLDSIEAPYAERKTVWPRNTTLAAKNLKRSRLGILDFISI
jgi:hypothetical protein